MARKYIDPEHTIKLIEYSADMGGPLGQIVCKVKEYAKQIVARTPAALRWRPVESWGNVGRMLATLRKTVGDGYMDEVAEVDVAIMYETGEPVIYYHGTPISEMVGIEAIALMPLPEPCGPEDLIEPQDRPEENEDAGNSLRRFVLSFDTQRIDGFGDYTLLASKNVVFVGDKNNDEAEVVSKLAHALKDSIRGGRCV